MPLRQQAVQFAQRRLSRNLSRRLSRRASRALPWIGTALALVAIGSAIRRKGVIRGTLDTALDAVPVVGGLKAVAETVRGRDFISGTGAARPR